MFSEKELNEFVNRMFENASTNNSDVKDGLQTFRKYLETTKMCSNEYLKKLDKIIECSSELIALRAKLCTLDVTSIIKTAPEKTPRQKPRQKSLGTYLSSSCMNSSPSSSRCGSSSPSYSDSCSGGSSYTNRC